MSTFAVEILNPNSVWHWLLKIEGQGLELRYSEGSEAGVNVTEAGRIYNYEGRLITTVRPSISINPYTTVVSVATVSFTVAPRNKGETDTITPDRFQDLEITKNFNWHQMTGKLYRWAENTVLAEAQLIIEGTIDNVRVETEGTVSFDLIDQSHKWDVGLPKKQIDEDNFPNASAEAFGQGYPIVYGAFTQAQLPTYDDVNDGGMISVETVNAVSQNQADGVAVGVTTALATTTDGDGVTYSYSDYAAASGQKQFTATGTGIQDDGQGTYTGTASQAIENPCDIIHHLARVIAEIPKANVNDVEIKGARIHFNRWEMSVIVAPGDSTSFFGVVAGLTKWMRAGCFFKEGKLTIRQLSFTRFADFNITDGNRLDTLSIDWGSKENVINHLTVRHSWGYDYKTREFKYRANVLRTKDNYANFERSEVLHGKRRAVIEARELNGGIGIRRSVNMMAELRWKPRKVIRERVDRTSHRVVLCDSIALTEKLGPSATGAGFSELRTICIGIEYGLSENTLTLLEAA